MEKKHILDELRRTAALNNGVAPGRLKFATDTGVQEHHWRGKYWARWSDAVTEAGLSPNQKVEAYDDAFLLEAFAGLVRELGRFPVTSDIRLRTRKGDGFPFDRAFRRLGTRAEIAAKVLAFVKDRPGFETVTGICEPEAGGSLEPGTLSPDKLVDGFVYLIQSGKRYKIGATADLASRSKAIAVQMPDPTKTVHVIRTDDPFGIESYWHRRFAEKRVGGEWFELSRDEVAAFRRRKTM